MVSCLSHCLHFEHKLWSFGSKLLDKLMILLNKSHFSFFCVLKLLELLGGQQLSIMQHFGASAFNMVVRWHKLGEMDIECTSYNSIILAICVPKLSNFVKIWRSTDKNKLGNFLGHLVHVLLPGLINITTVHMPQCVKRKQRFSTGKYGHS